MWTPLLMLCLIACCDLSVAEEPPRTVNFGDRLNDGETTPRKVEDSDAPIRLSRKFNQDDSRVQRLHIENQTGFDGKVRDIRIDSANGDRPGVRAYGLPKKHLEDSGLIERVPMTGHRFAGDSRSAPLVEAYGMSKDRLENNGQIERVAPILLRNGAQRNTANRATRSIDTELSTEVEKKSDAELEDLEAQDAKVFRPLFVYRQQVARRQGRNRAVNYVDGHHQGNYKYPEYRRLYY